MFLGLSFPLTIALVFFVGKNGDKMANTCTMAVIDTMATNDTMADNERIVYPETFRDESVEILHGREIADPYRWLEDPESEDTKNWVKTQQELTSSIFRKMNYREELLDSLKAKFDFPKYGCPVKRPTGYYFTYKDGLQNHYVLKRIPSLDTPLEEAEVVVDPNGLSADGLIALGNWALTDDGLILAYSLCQSGSDWRTIHFRRMSDFAEEEVLQWVKFSGFVKLHKWLLCVNDESSFTPLHFLVLLKYIPKVLSLW